MKTVAMAEQQSSKDRRQRKVLLALVDYYIRTGKPVGSATLKDEGFPELSSATLRNYFAELEKDGFLLQQHSSAGRLPSDSAYRLYAEEMLRQGQTGEQSQSYPLPHDQLSGEETREIAQYLQKAAEALSDVTQMAVFLSAPRFDHDFVTAIRLVRISPQRLVCLLVSEFGDIQTFILPSAQKLSSFAVKRIEDYCQWRLNGQQKPENLEPDEESLAQSLYNEAMLRYIVRYSNFIDEEIYRTGFSKLLLYPEFRDPVSLASSLSLFENAHSMRLLLRQCSSTAQMKFWIGQDLLPYSQQSPYCSVLATPYSVNTVPVGAMGLLGPTRMPYSQLFGLLARFSEAITDTLTRSVYKFKISYRQPELQALHLPKDSPSHRLLRFESKDKGDHHHE